MSINYEVLIIGLVVINISALIIFVRLLDKINALRDALVRHEKRAREIHDHAYEASKMTGFIGCTLDDVKEKINYLCDSVDELFEEDEDCEWTPEPVEPLVAVEKKSAPVELPEVAIEIEEDPIHIITPNQYFFEQGHDKFDLEYDISSEGLFYSYYDTEGRLVSFAISNVTECIGDGLKYFGVNSNNDEIVYIRNNVYHADFMIKKVEYDG